MNMANRCSIYGYISYFYIFFGKMIYMKYNIIYI
uniref:Uncharacterized protein n=1 Tax=viral metagenome TaxID=1070528 RepID=A0A6C0K7H9_9ZZZZ